MSYRHLNGVLMIVLGLFVDAPSIAAELTVTSEAQTALGITIYNNNLALVRDSRRLSIEKGVTTLEFVDVSAEIRPETALLEGATFQVLEQNFDYDLLSPAKLLEKAVGSDVRLYRTNPATGAETIETATVLSTNGGTVLRIGSRIEVMSGGIDGLGGRLVFDNIPPNLKARPTLSMLIESGKSGNHNVTLNYLTGGLSWRADYVARLSPDEKSIALQGWVTLANTSGTGFNNASVQLVAGEVNQVTPQARRSTSGVEYITVTARSRGAAEESLLDYHLYTLARQTSIANNQTKQVELLSAPDVVTKKILESKGGSYYYRSRSSAMTDQKASIYLELKNTREDGLGMPLPKGIVRVYKADSRGMAQFVGEDEINHTANKETIRLTLGKSFDVSIGRKQTSYSETPGMIGKQKYIDYRTGHEIKVANGKDEAVQVRLIEAISGDWSIYEESDEYVKEDAFTAVWTVNVPAESEKTIAYSVLTRHMR